VIAYEQFTDVPSGRRRCSRVTGCHQGGTAV
jgi:hypothetical protein